MCGGGGAAAVRNNTSVKIFLFAVTHACYGLIKNKKQQPCITLIFFVFVFQNSSSWVLYNMASFYWRMKNEPQKAVDCVVRALHFSPR